MMPVEPIATLLPGEKIPRSSDTGISRGSPLLLSTTWSLVTRLLCAGKLA
jgi:hypothetical protein